MHVIFFLLTNAECLLRFFPTIYAFNLCFRNVMIVLSILPKMPLCIFASFTGNYLCVFACCCYQPNGKAGMSAVVVYWFLWLRWLTVQLGSAAPRAFVFILFSCWFAFACFLPIIASPHLVLVDKIVLPADRSGRGVTILMGIEFETCLHLAVSLFSLKLH
jgi:hypothetical protein